MATGHGVIARALADRGARVVGVDISESLLARARVDDIRDPRGITYVCADASLPDTLRNEKYDLVISHFGLSDIDDLDGVFASVHRLLEQGGTFVFSILHPCFP